MSTSQLHVELSCKTGKLEVALRELSRAVELELLDIVWLDRLPLLEPLRQMSAFAELRARVSARAARVVEAWQRQ